MRNYKISTQILVTLTANVGAIAFGMMLGWSGVTVDDIVDNDEFYFPVSAYEFSWIVALMPLGAAFSVSFSGLMRDKLGTRLTIFLFVIPITIGYTLITLPLNIEMLLAGRFLIGITAGCYVFVPIFYVGEIASIEIRGALLAFFFFMVNFGVLVIFIIGHFASLIAVNATCGIVPILYSIAFIFLRESPAMLIYKNRIEEAKECILFLRGATYNYQAEIDDLKIRIQTFQDRIGFRKIFTTKSTRKALFLIMGMFFFFQMSGINILPFYATMIFSEAGFEFLAGISSIVVASMQVISCIYSVVCVDRFGRRPLLISSTAVMSLCLMGIGTYFFLKENSIDMSKFMYMPLTLFCIFVVAFSIGLAPVTYVLLGEFFLFEAKIYVAPLTKVVNFSLAFMIALTFVLLVSSVGFGITFYIFATFNFLGCIFSFLFIPETKGTTLAEIQTILGM
ncbi:hypothetical protein PVAND_009576 [Polypedilum vanderplanki]|uniref:Major facilitator superfamily (MFS) profile domain-containing protein n=1 Tax=Polypedilum vanderplanki TaxID=319348 RepID=A0A9J6CDP1_POLVA|nr:hypothetical protein PVAND_009576 [Polypedilum vanderplanki]